MYNYMGARNGEKDGGGRGRTYLSDSELEWGRVRARLGSDESTIAVAKSVSECESPEGRAYSQKEDAMAHEEGGHSRAFRLPFEQVDCPSPASPIPSSGRDRVDVDEESSPLDSQFFRGEGVSL
jgi:hypothetical protein